MRAAAKKEKMMWETLREAIDEEMEADPTVLVMGEQRADKQTLLWLRARLPAQQRVVGVFCRVLSASLRRMVSG